MNPQKILPLLFTEEETKNNAIAGVDLGNGLWFKADDTNALTLNGSNQVTSWSSSGGQTVSLTPAIGEEPTLVANQINGFRVIRADGTDGLSANLPTNFKPKEFFAVVKHNRIGVFDAVFSFGDTQNDLLLTSSSVDAEAYKLESPSSQVFQSGITLDQTEFNILGGSIQNTGVELITNGNFTNWTGDDPDGWTVFGESGTNEVTRNGNAARIISDGANVGIFQNILDEVNQKFYELTFDLTVVNGGLRVQNTGGYTENFTNSGTYTRTIQATGVDGVLEFKRNTGITDITISNISVKEVNSTLRFNTEEVASGQLDNPVSTQFQLFQGWDGNLKGQYDIAEVIIFDRVLTSSERSKIQNYLINKYFPSALKNPDGSPILDSNKNLTF